VGHVHIEYAKIMKSFIKKHSRKAILFLFLLIVAGLLFFFLKKDDTNTASTTLVVEQVALGTVTTGIQTTGTIVAADILDLNVYKLTNRIDEVHIANGLHVEEGQLLFAFDQSDVEVEIAESKIGIEEAKLSLEVEREKVSDPNTTVTSLEDSIAKLEADIQSYSGDVQAVYRDFYSSDLEAVPSSKRYNEQIQKEAPTIGGLYTSFKNGEYFIQVYASGESSGYSYHLSGLESGTYPVFPGSEVMLGTRGLTITFPSENISSWDEWVVVIPNVHASTYPENLETFENTLDDLEEDKQSNSVELANKKITLKQTKRGDTTSKRELGVETAALAIQKARVDLQKGIDTQDERRIVAPFSGTIEGMDNVVVGATPTKESNDTINFGSLISDDFMVTFSLNAHDVGRVSLWQKVLVTLTSVASSTPLEAEIVEISSLPDESAVAQYEVLAKIKDFEKTGLKLRDGMLMDVEIVQEEKSNVVRVPTSAVHYKEGVAYVTFVEGLSEKQYTQMQKMGIVRQEGTKEITTIERKVEVGLRGEYYTEIVSGLDVGEIIVSTTSTVSTGTVVETGAFPGSDMGRMKKPNTSGNK